MNVRVIIYMALVLCLMFLNCSSSTNNYEGEVTIQGKVFDILDNDTLYAENQIIKIGDFIVSTDEEGSFESLVPQGTYAVQVNSENHLMFEKQVEITEDLNYNIELPQKMVWTFALKLGTIWVYNEGEFVEEVVSAKKDGPDSLFFIERRIKQDSTYTTTFTREIRKDYDNGSLTIEKDQFGNRKGYCQSIFDTITSDGHDSREYKLYTHYPKSRLINNRIIEYSCCGDNSNHHRTTFLLPEKKGFQCFMDGPDYRVREIITETIISSN